MELLIIAGVVLAIVLLLPHLLKFSIEIVKVIMWIITGILGFVLFAWIAREIITFLVRILS